MARSNQHTFHIPVMGLGYTIDTPVKVARFGISSVLSIIEDGLMEQMRKFHCERENELYVEIDGKDVDHRAKRTTAYLNLLDKIVRRQTEKLKAEPFEKGNEIVKYFEMLPDDSPVRLRYEEMLVERDKVRKREMQDKLRREIKAGSIDVNIMTKCDRINYSDSGEALPVEYADAMASLRGFATSDLNSSVVFSAGMNPRLYSYCETFKDFFPDKDGNFKKKIVLKVSDYRSAIIQGKFLAKKGLWITEFRIESGLNCGGHAFPTDGYLLGPILEEFKTKKEELTIELFNLYKNALDNKKIHHSGAIPELKISVQGGIGTWEENKFLLEYYNLDATGWGSPFLLVPEATNVDEETLKNLCFASPSDYFLSNASPLGLPFNNFRKSSAERQRLERIEKGRPGSPCYKKFLAFSTEFSKEPICTASREYQNLKLKQLGEKGGSLKKIKEETISVTEKDCLCEGLSSSVLLKNNIPVPHNLTAVTICPGPNLAYFSGVFTLKEMVDHIYGKKILLNKEKRPNLFVKELNMYVDYLKKEVEKTISEVSEKKKKYFEEFKSNLLNGIEYYVNLLPEMKLETENYLNNMYNDLNKIREELQNSILPEKISLI